MKKDTNPKDAIANGKLPLHLWPETATAIGCMGLLEGNLKYGRTNWREGGVLASVYVGALRRHINQWFEGQELDSESGLHQLSHILACAAILADAWACGSLVDDRMYADGEYSELVDTLLPEIKRLNKKYENQPTPKHFSKLTKRPYEYSCKKVEGLIDPSEVSDGN